MAARPKDRCVAIALLLPGLAALSAQAQDPAAELGKLRAADSRLEWDVREARHPVLGNIRYAYTRRSVETPVGDATLYSRAYLSCQQDRRTFAIELANATAPAEPGGLLPAAEPRLVCHRPTPDGKVAREDLLATWEVNATIGDALTRGLRAFPLRECAAIGVVQEVRLPGGWPQATARIEFEILPYDRTLDSIFAACGEPSAHAAPRAPGAAPSVAVAAVAPVVAGPAAAPSPWKTVRTLARGRTNVRARPDTSSAIVALLPAGASVQVQHATGDWWRARSQGKAKFEGFIREDRLALR